jgi:hypothetical protein
MTNDYLVKVIVWLSPPSGLRSLIGTPMPG